MWKNEHDQQTKQSKDEKKKIELLFFMIAIITEYKVLIE